MSVLKSPPDPTLLLRLAEEFGTPTYVYFAAIIRRQVAGLRQSLSGLPVQLLYAMKANSHPAVLAVMREAGLGIDAVSPGELLLARRVGLPAAAILFSANNMTDEDMHFAHSQGVLLNIGELSRLEQYGRTYPGSAVCVRLNPQIGGGHHAHVITAGARSKFGIPVGQIDAVQAVVARHGLRLVGLHQHIGSGILDAPLLGQAIQVLLDVAPAFPDVQFLNLGGGLGIPYHPDEAPLDLSTLQHHLVPLLRTFAQTRSHVQFRFEPGRYLVAESGVLLMRTNTIKHANDRVFVGTDSGFNHLVRPAMYEAYHALYNLSHPDGPLTRCDVVGNICESGDVFARDRWLQQVREGDVLAVLDAGAYGMSMASTYNLRPLPAEVMVEADGSARLVTRRQSVAELVDALLEAG
jgi:diaminopimelate decarboxylase